jgi:adenosine/AMP kinase
LAKQNAINIACGHSFIIFLGNAFPLNIMNSIKNVPEIVRIFCATANETEVIIAETELGRGILGVIDGVKTRGIETGLDISERHDFLRTIGYKL